MNVKELTERLIRREFGGLLIKIRFSGPFAEEDLDVSVLLKEKPDDWVYRSHRIRRKLRDEGWDVLMGYETSL